MARSASIRPRDPRTTTCTRAVGRVRRRLERLGLVGELEIRRITAQLTVNYKRGLFVLEDTFDFGVGEARGVVSPK